MCGTFPVGTEPTLPIIVRNLQSRSTNGSFDCTASVTLDGVERPLTLSRYGDHPELSRRTDTYDPLAVALLVPAMLRGEPPVIEGSIDEMLLESLRGSRSSSPTPAGILSRPGPGPASP